MSGTALPRTTAGIDARAATILVAGCAKWGLALVAFGIWLVNKPPTA